jgi:hypothetical protein
MDYDTRHETFGGIYTLYFSYGYGWTGNLHGKYKEVLGILTFWSLGGI